MGSQSTRAGAAKAFHPGLSAALFLCAAVAGCDHYCLQVSSNPGATSSTTFTNSTCTVTKVTGNVSVSFGSSLASASTSGAPSAPHIFVALRGIDALPSPVEGQDVPAWQSLAPQLAALPVQVDVLARAAASCAPSPLGVSAVPAGVYNEIRLRIVPNSAPNHASMSEALPADNPCGGITFSCIVAQDASTRPLDWADPPELRISSGRISGGFFRVLPDSTVHLEIEFDPRSSIVVPAGDFARLVPSFSVSERPSCATADLPEP